MKRKDKENLVQKIGMRFDEAVELFSEETLESMAMNNILGGGTNKDSCVQNGCTPGSDSNEKACVQNGCSSGTSSTSTSSSSSSSSNLWGTIITAAATITAAIIAASSN